MLTSFTWVPLGALKMIPLHSTVTAEVAREKLKQQYPDEHAAVAAAASSTDDDDGAASGDGDDLFNRIGVGDRVMDDIESDDDEEVADTTFKPTDLVFVATRADTEEPKLEVFVYDDPQDNLYVHHDVTVTAFPLTSAWLTDGSMALLALGTMLPFIELWPLDVLDAVEPLCVLGGCEKPEDNYRRRMRRLKAASHKEAVLSVRWNTTVQQFLASGSADATVKIWDLTSQDCVATMVEADKVQSLWWHPDEAHLLLSGMFNGQVSIHDCRDADLPVMTLVPDSTSVEHCEFDPTGTRILVSASSGAFYAYDPRKPTEAIWQLEPHDADTTFACSPQLKGLLATGGKDGFITLWDCRRDVPELIVSRKYRTGSVLALEFHPNNELVLGAGGSRGEPLVYTFTQDVLGRFDLTTKST